MAPKTLTAGLAEALRGEGVSIHEKTKVTGFESERGMIRALATEEAIIPVDAVVIACGAESGVLAAACDVQLPMTAGKGYSITIDRPAKRLRGPLYLGESKVGFTPMGDSLRLAGTMELSGINRKLDPKRIKAIRTAADKAVDVPEALEGGKEWVGMRPMVPDTLPVIGPLPSRKNVFVNTGHQMLGVTLSLSSGWALAHQILGQPSPIDLGPFSPTRF